MAFAVLTSAAIASTTTLVDQHGKRFALESLLGTPVVVTFVAARCTDACPLINAQIAAAAHDPRAAALHVRFLTVTLDPEHDTPQTMRAIADRFNARTPRWILASGEIATVHALMRSFDVIAQRGPDGVPDMHTTFVYIMNAQGRLKRALLASPDLAPSIYRAIEQ